MLCSPNRLAFLNGFFLVFTFTLTSSSPFCLGLSCLFFLAFGFGVATSAEELDGATPVGALDDDGGFSDCTGPFSTLPKMGIGGIVQTVATGKTP